MNNDKEPQTACSHEVELDEALLSQPAYRTLIDIRLFLAQMDELHDLWDTAAAVIARQKEQLAS